MPRDEAEGETPLELSLHTVLSATSLGVTQCLWREFDHAQQREILLNYVRVLLKHGFLPALD